jgi:uncharacterized protein (TIGR00725 family)
LRLTSFASLAVDSIREESRFLMGRLHEYRLQPVKPSRYVAVCGASDPDSRQRQLAEEVGKLLGEAGAVVLCGGLGGVMEAASEGAAGAGGTVVGLLPGPDRSHGNPHLTLALATGLGEARNAVLTCAADSVIAIGRGWGTLSEIALACKRGREVVTLESWPVEGVPAAASPEEAVRAALGGRDDSSTGADKGAA